MGFVTTPWLHRLSQQGGRKLTHDKKIAAHTAQSVDIEEMAQTRDRFLTDANLGSQVALWDMGNVDFMSGALTIGGNTTQQLFVPCGKAKGKAKAKAKSEGAPAAKAKASGCAGGGRSGGGGRGGVEDAELARLDLNRTHRNVSIKWDTALT